MPRQPQLERRFTTAAGAALRRDASASSRSRATAGGDVISGYGALFNVETIIAGLFRERIAPGAFKSSLRDDICVAFNHDPNYILGRTANKTARVTEDRTGLRYECDVNSDDSQALSVAAKIDRRDVSGSSFSFIIDDDKDEEWVRDDPAKLPLRIIKRARCVELGPVAMPAYGDTTATIDSQRGGVVIPRQALAGSVALRQVLERELELELLDIDHSPGPVAELIVMRQDIDRQLRELDRVAPAAPGTLAHRQMLERQLATELRA